MTIQEYSEKALRTAPEGMSAAGFAGGRALSIRFLDWGEPMSLIDSMDWLHGLVGMIGESGEIADAIGKEGWNWDGGLPHEDVRKEIGDFMWYANILCRAMRWNFEGLLRSAKEEEVESTRTIHLSEIAEAYKKWIFYGKEIREKQILHSMRKVMTYTLKEIGGGDETLGIILDENIEKLKKRYPEKFSEEIAKNHNGE